jgi:hypothetical protein
MSIKVRDSEDGGTGSQLATCTGAASARFIGKS